MSENLTGGRSWFFTSVGLEVFHVKICVFHIFVNCAFCWVCSAFSLIVPSAGSRTVSPNRLADCLRKFGNNLERHNSAPLVSCTPKLNSLQFGLSLLKLVQPLAGVRLKDTLEKRFFVGCVRYKELCLGFGKLRPQKVAKL